MSALNVLCAQLMSDLFAIAKFLLLLAQALRMDNFLQSYKDILREKNVNTFSLNDFQSLDQYLQTVLSAVVVLLRRHSINGRLCCEDNDDDLHVTDVDRWGFVTEVKCKKCHQTMETTCYNAKCTYERIYNVSQLKAGDHIFWYRPYLILHHAIISKLDDAERKIIEYAGNSCTCPRVVENAMPKNNSSCDALYRVNYQDCYDADYTILRARKLLNESRYNLLKRNCEHFSSWCKTGTTSSIQVGIFWALVGKFAFTIGLRVLALVVILGLITYIHEEQEETTKDRQWLETLERWLTGIYIATFTLVFTIYLLFESVSKLHPCKRSDQCSNCCPCTCCRRPCNLVFGLCCRIVIRELLAAGGTLLVVLFEETITNAADMAQLCPAARTAILIAYSTLALAGGYVVGVFLGRWVDAGCDSCEGSRCCRAVKINSSYTPIA